MTYQAGIKEKIMADTEVSFEVKNFDELERLTNQVKEDVERLKASIEKLNAFKLRIEIK